jgi:asparagine synthase (glutamine-hydrolysing)
MNAFVCVFGRDRVGARRSVDGSWSVADAGPFWAAVTGNARIVSLNASNGERLIAVGKVRLANRVALRRELRLPPDSSAQISDLELVARAHLLEPAFRPTKLVGDFSYVVWSSGSTSLKAARDIAGVQTLYYRVESGLFVAASNADLVASEERYHAPFLIEFLSGGVHDHSASAFAGVRALRRATTMTVVDWRANEQRYWQRPGVRSARTPGERDELTHRFMDLIVESVAFHLNDASCPWSTLSGGLDSSTLVATAAFLRRTARVTHELGGTVTLHDSMPGADDHDYVEAVLSATGVRNLGFWDYGLWHNDGSSPPRTDRPEMAYPFYARERAMGLAVLAAGGTDIWMGSGPDNLLTAPSEMLAALLARGRVADMWRQALTLAIRSQQSVWHMLARFAFEPFGRFVSGSRARASRPLPRWLRAHIRDENGAGAVQTPPGTDAPRPDKLDRISDEVLDALSWNASYRFPFPDGIEVRYPYLYQPLYEFACSLPLELKRWDAKQKVVLRKCTAGVLPDEIRWRKGKATIGPRVIASLVEEAPVVRTLTHESVLADLGLIEPRRLQTAINRMERDGRHYDQILDTLALETWLRVRLGTWRDLRGPSKPRVTGGAKPHLVNAVLEAIR